MKKIIAMLLIAMLIPLALYADLNVNRYIGLTGYFTDVGAPVTGSYDLILSIWEDETSILATDKVWEETHLAVWVDVGEFSVKLGYSSPLINNPTWPDLNFAQNIKHWLEIKYRTAGGGSYTTFTTRKEILSAAHSVSAMQIDVRTDDPDNPITGQIWLVVP